MLDPVLRRTRVEEWMDDPDLDPVRHQSALAGLRRLNRVSQVSGVFYRQIRRLSRQISDRPLHVLDIASGSADLPIDWLCRARQDGISLSVTALDRSDFAIRTAVQAAKEADVSLGTVCRDCLTESLPSRFDVVTCSLFMHHLDPPHVSRLIQEMWRVCEGTLIICDLERSRTNLAMVAAASRLLSKSDIVHHDAGASVRAAYTRREFAGLLESSLGFQVPVKQSFPCRFLAIVDQVCEAEYVPNMTPAVAGAMP